MKPLWIALAIVMVFGFTVLGWIGSRIYQEMPPVPERVVTTEGQVVVPAGAIAAGQAQILLSLLPVGLLQTWASVQYGYWYARSAEFLDLGLLRTLRWLRVPGDTLFAIGAIAFVVFIFGLRFGYSVKSAAPGRIAPEPAGARTRS